MADRSKIEWTDATWNPIRARNRETGKVGHYCEHASDGCRHCYSETFNRRGIGAGIAFQRQNRERVELFLDETMLTQPLRWRRPRKIFVCSMTDLFGDFVPDEWIDRLFAVMALCPQHTFLVLSKRAGRMRRYCSDPRTVERVAALLYGSRYEQRGNPPLLADDGGTGNRRTGTHLASGEEAWKGTGDRHGPLFGGHSQDLDTYLALPLPNVWLGVSVEDQPNADERIPDLLATPAAKRFISAEPLLGAIDLSGWVGEIGNYRRGQFPLDDQIGLHRPQQRDDITGSADLPSAAGLPSSPLDAHVVPTQKPAEGRLEPRQYLGRGAVDREPTPILSPIPSPPVRPKGMTEPDEFAGDRRSAGAYRSSEIANAPAGKVAGDDSVLPLDGPNVGHGRSYRAPQTTISWVICGGESGPGARPMHPDWVRSLRDQCAAAGIPFFFKQWGEWSPVARHRSGVNAEVQRMAGAPIGKWHAETDTIRVGKRAAGALLDGREWRKMPT